MNGPRASVSKLCPVKTCSVDLYTFFIFVLIHMRLLDRFKYSIFETIRRKILSKMKTYFNFSFESSLVTLFTVRCNNSKPCQLVQRARICSVRLSR